MSKMLPPYDLIEVLYIPVNVDNKEASSVAGLKKTVANACAVRLSYVFNHVAGHKIPAKPRGVHGNVEPGLNGYYIFGSRGFANYMSKTYGAPDKHSSADHLADYTDRKGIIFYDMLFEDAFGHIALWDGANGYYGEYFEKAKRVWFWEAP